MDFIVSQHELTLRSLDFTKSAAESTQKRITKMFYALIFSLDELGVWLALKVHAFLLQKLSVSHVSLRFFINANCFFL